LSPGLHLITVGYRARISSGRTSQGEEQVDVRIGITQAPREIEVELPENTSADDLAAKVEKAVSASTMLWLTDKRGRRVGIPAAKLAYIELDTGAETRRVGFGAAV
jgi:Protein of unknown function (DUF3107)